MVMGVIMIMTVIMGEVGMGGALCIGVGMGHTGMSRASTMFMIVELMKMGLTHLFVEVLVLMDMGMKMDMDMAIRAMGMAVGMEKLADDLPVFFIHILFMENAMQQFMGHQGERQLQFVLLQQMPVVEDLGSRPIGRNASVHQQQATAADLQGNIQIVGAQENGLF